jgi:hypothetical protein
VSKNGEVEITRSGTVQVKQFHPVTVSVGLRLPIGEGETPEQAIERVDGICADQFNSKMMEVVNEGFKWDAKAAAKHGAHRDRF